MLICYPKRKKRSSDNIKKSLSLFILFFFCFFNLNLYAKGAYPKLPKGKEYEQALTKYNEKDYLEAINLFQSDLKKHPKRALSYYYIALSGLGLRERKLEPCDQGSLDFIWSHALKSVQLEPEFKNKIKNNPEFKELTKQVEYLTLIEGLDPKVPEDLKKILLKAHWEYVRTGNYPVGDLILKENQKLLIKRYFIYPDSTYTKKIRGTYSLKGAKLLINLKHEFMHFKNLVCDIEIDGENAKNMSIDCHKYTKTVYHFVNGGYECGG